MMTTILLKYDENNSLAQKAIELIKEMKIFMIEESMNELDKAMKEAKEGKTTKCKDFDDFLDKINE